MKRCWIGFGLLIILLVLSLLVTGFMTRVHEDIERDLNQSAACALSRDWDNAELFFQRAQNTWRKWEHLRACFADHSPVEEIDAAFTEAEVYLTAKEDADYPAVCRSLAKKVAAVGEAHKLVWWNML